MSEQKMPSKFDLYVYELDGRDDLDELGDVLRAWAQPRGRRFSLMRSIPQTEATRAAIAAATNERRRLRAELMDFINERLYGPLPGTDEPSTADGPSVSDQSPVLR